jgi:hypothetical protein
MTGHADPGVPSSFLIIKPIVLESAGREIEGELLAQRARDDRTDVLMQIYRPASRRPCSPFG